MTASAGFVLRGISKAYGMRSVLEDVSLALMPGQSLALLGPSGSGKTTILRILAGLETPDRGQVLLDGRVLTDADKLRVPPHRRDVSIVFQDLALWPNLTGLGNVVLGLSGSGVSKAEARQRAAEALSLCGIETLKDRRPGTMSGGEQQRVALARALAPRPKFLFLDEPFANLDFVTKTKLLSQISILAVQNQITAVVVTHDLFEALAMAELAVVIDAGRAVASGRINDLMASSSLPLFSLLRERSLGTRGCDAT